jgi:hypothetical protein
MNDIWGSKCADFSPAHFLQLILELCGQSNTRLSAHVAVQTLALDGVRIAHSCRFRASIVKSQRVLHFRGADSVARDIDDIVHSSSEPAREVKLKLNVKEASARVQSTSSIRFCLFCIHLQ